MKAILLNDEVNQLHWSMLKAVVLVLSLLPVSQGLLHVWQATEGSSQIMVGFVFISLFASLSLLSFGAALYMLDQHLNADEQAPWLQKVVSAYRYVPMLSLASMFSYLATML